MLHKGDGVEDEANRLPEMRLGAGYDPNRRDVAVRTRRKDAYTGRIECRDVEAACRVPHDTERLVQSGAGSRNRHARRDIPVPVPGIGRHRIARLVGDVEESAARGRTRVRRASCEQHNQKHGWTHEASLDVGHHLMCCLTNRA